MSYPEAHKEARNLGPSLLGVYYSSVLKQQLKPVRHISTQADSSVPPNSSSITQSSSTSKKKNCDVYCATSGYVSPRLELLPPSSELVKVEYQINWTQNSLGQCKKSPEHQTKSISTTSTLPKLEASQIQGVKQKTYTQKDHHSSVPPVENCEEKKQEINP